MQKVIEDQELANMVFAQSPELNIIVDSWTQIFQSMHLFNQGDIDHISTLPKSCSEKYMEKTPPRNNLTNNTAYFLHSNGLGKDWREGCMQEISKVMQNYSDFGIFDLERNVYLHPKANCYQ